MPKKTKRQYRRDTAISQPVVSGAAAPVQKTSEFSPDYTHVIQDLRRIGILAGSFIAILVILAIVLPK
jgi:hypothetical protein